MPHNITTYIRSHCKTDACICVVFMSETTGEP